MEKLDKLIERASYDNRVLLSSGNAFSRPNGAGFFIYVVADGNVTYTTAGGQTQEEAMTVGYHPTKFIAITADTEVNLVICF